MKTLRGKIVTSALLSLDEADLRKPINQLVNEQLIDDDVLAVEYANNFFLHVGWHSHKNSPPSTELMGNFEVVLTKNHDLENPISVWRCKDFNELWPVIEFADEWVNRQA